MKKFLSLALCALMIFSAASSVFAADENVYATDFEDKDLGPVPTSLDAYSIHSTPKDGSIEIVEFDGDKALRINHPAKEAGYDNFSQLLYNNAEGIAKWGAKNQFVIEYDVYFEQACDDMTFHLGRAAGQGATGTAWLIPAYVKGSDLAVYVTGIENPVTNLKLKTWYTISLAYDLDKKVSSVYIDGVNYAKNMAFANDIVGPLVKYVRLAFNATIKGDCSAYLDNIKVYNATQPRVIHEASAPQTADIAVVLAAVAAVAASGVIVSKKRK
ncbi:MAG: hypothetical protein E7463_14215 [Ruminococcaceae bacterium]|nr:hypothetical protein [Oscillospiraceae bacterium]